MEKKFQQLDVPIIRAKSVTKNVSLTVATGEDFLLLDAPPTNIWAGMVSVLIGQLSQYSS